MLYDRDVVAFYGDPAWEARMAERPKAYEQKLDIDGDTYTLTITGNRGAKSFSPVNENGAQRGWRPIVQFLPQRVKDVKIIDDGGLNAVVADDFILVPNPRVYDEAKAYQVKFSAKPM